MALTHQDTHLTYTDIQEIFRLFCHIHSKASRDHENTTIQLYTTLLAKAVDVPDGFFTKLFKSATSLPGQCALVQHLPPCPQIYITLAECCTDRDALKYVLAIVQDRQLDQHPMFKWAVQHLYKRGGYASLPVLISNSLVSSGQLLDIAYTAMNNNDEHTINALAGIGYTVPIDMVGLFAKHDDVSLYNKISPFGKKNRKRKSQLPDHGAKRTVT